MFQRRFYPLYTVWLALFTRSVHAAGELPADPFAVAIPPIAMEAPHIASNAAASMPPLTLKRIGKQSERAASPVTSDGEPLFLRRSDSLASLPIPEPIAPPQLRNLAIVDEVTATPDEVITTPLATETLPVSYTPLSKPVLLKGKGWTLNVVGLSRPGKLLSVSRNERITAQHEWLLLFVELRSNRTDVITPEARDLYLIGAEGKPCNYPSVSSVYPEHHGLSSLRGGTLTHISSALLFDVPATTKLRFGTLQQHVALDEARQIALQPPLLRKLPATTP